VVELSWSTIHPAPKQAAVFRKAAADSSEYADFLEEDESVFERLTRGQKQLAILLIARALLDLVSEPPRIWRRSSWMRLPRRQPRSRP
jgi:hypothetical protein